MAEFAIGLGVLLAIFGPLLLLPVTWAVHRWVTRPAVRALAGVEADDVRVGWLAAGCAVLLVAAVVAGSWLPGRVEFARQCAAHGSPVIDEVTRVDGFYRNRLLPHDARRFLAEFGFSWVEGPHPYREGATVRYTLSEDGAVHEEDMAEPRSAYVVGERLENLRFGGHRVDKRVHERDGGREIARAAFVVYEGGPLSIFLGAHAMVSCPDVRDEQGSRDFRTYYDLERIVLRAPATG